MVFLIRFLTSIRFKFLFLSWHWQMIEFSAPSSSRMFPLITDATYSITSSGGVKSLFFIFDFNTARRDSYSGGTMSPIIPPSKRDRNLSSRLGMYFGILSDEKIICLFWS